MMQLLPFLTDLLTTKIPDHIKSPRRSLRRQSGHGAQPGGFSRSCSPHRHSGCPTITSPGQGIVQLPLPLSLRPRPSHLPRLQQCGIRHLLASVSHRRRANKRRPHRIVRRPRLRARSGARDGAIGRVTCECGSRGRPGRHHGHERGPGFGRRRWRLQRWCFSTSTEKGRVGAKKATLREDGRGSSEGRAHERVAERELQMKQCALIISRSLFLSSFPFPPFLSLLPPSCVLFTLPRPSRKNYT